MNADSKGRRIVVKRNEQNIAKEREFYQYAKSHPEICPPVGYEMHLQNAYGVHIKLIVQMVLNGLPGTEVKVLPLSEQPEHLRDETILSAHIKEKLGFTCWPDIDCWAKYQKLTSWPIGQAGEGAEKSNE